MEHFHFYSCTIKLLSPKLTQARVFFPGIGCSRTKTAESYPPFRHGHQRNLRFHIYWMMQGFSKRSILQKNQRQRTYHVSAADLLFCCLSLFHFLPVHISINIIHQKSTEANHYRNVFLVINTCHYPQNDQNNVIGCVCQCKCRTSAKC